MATISVGDITPRNQYTATANQTVFAYNFPIFVDADIRVYIGSTLKTLTTHYTVSGAGTDNGGNVTLGTGASVGDVVTIYRDMAVSRTSDYQANGDLLAETLNDDLDKIVMMVQQQEDQVNNNTLTVDQFDDTSIDLTLPVKATRLGTVLGFNATTGAPEAGPTIANVNALSAITANINTVAGISANVTTVAGISANTTTVAGISSAVTSVAGKATEIGLLGVSGVITDMGLLGTSDCVADMAILGTSDVVSDMNTLATSDIVTDMNLLATSANVTAMGLLGTSANVTAMGLLGVSGVITDMNLIGTSAVVADLDAVADKITEIGRLGTSDAVADMNTLGTSAIVTDMDLLATSANVTAMGHLGTSANVTAMGLLGTSAVVADMALLGTSDCVADMALLATSDVISDMNTLATSDIIADLNTLATSDIVTDMNLLATSANVTAMGLLGTSAVIADMALLGTSAVVADMAILATSDVVADMNTLATSDIVSDLNTLATSDIVSDLSTVADNIAGVNSFADRYRVAGSAPASSLDEGDLYYNTSTNVLSYYNGSAWASITTYTHPNHSGEVTSTGDGATVIASNIVDEDNLKISNAGSDGQYLQKQSGNTGGLTWAAVDALPSQSSQSGKYLTTNGSVASWGTLDTDANTTTKGLYEHAHTIAANYTIASGNNAMAAGPITINSGVSVTVPTGSTWTIV